MTSYDLLAREVFLMGNVAARGDASVDLPMRVAARATSAAPTYFEPIPVSTGRRRGSPARGRRHGGEQPRHGGVRRGVPAPPGGPDDHGFAGNGDQLDRPPPDEVRDWGAGHWGRVILRLLIDGTSVVHQELAEVLGAGEYHRLQTDFGDASEALDDASDENIDRLKALAATLIAGRDRELDELCALLAR